MSAVRLAINGFGRIGRCVLRALHESGRDDAVVVAVNDLGDPAFNAHLLRYDSVHGRFPGRIDVAKNFLHVGDSAIRVTAERDPAKLDWKALNVDVALECTGLFASRASASAHLEAGARKVLVSAPASDVARTVVYGVNHDRIRPTDDIVSNASCTTNCLAPVARVIHDAVGIECGYMTTIHAFTGDQPTLDSLHKDPFRARAASLSMIPTSTGAARAVGLVLPELAGRIDGVAVRVPTPNVSAVDLTFVPERDTDPEEINAALRTAAGGALNGVLAYSADACVSVDFNHDPHSATVAARETRSAGKRLLRVFAWYDNEWGFSNRMLDTAVVLARVN